MGAWKRPAPDAPTFADFKKDLQQIREENMEDSSTKVIKAMSTLADVSKQYKPYLKTLKKIESISVMCEHDEFFMYHRETRDYSWPGDPFKVIRPMGDTTATSAEA